MESRPLTERETEILTFLLTADFPGVEKLREQAQSAQVVGECACGCATVDLEVDAAAPVAEEIPQANAVNAAGRSRPEAELPPELILFVRDGRLESIEIVWFDEAPIAVFPPAEEFEPPAALWLAKM
jgi:hypothetical protein